MARMVFLALAVIGKLYLIKEVADGNRTTLFLKLPSKDFSSVFYCLIAKFSSKHFASTYDVKILTVVFICYILIGILIGIDRSLLTAFKNANVGLDWTRLIIYTIPLFITFIFSSFNILGFTYRFLAAMKDPFEWILLIIIGYTIVKSLKLKE